MSALSQLMSKVSDMGDKAITTLKGRTRNGVQSQNNVRNEGTQSKTLPENRTQLHCEFSE